MVPACVLCLIARSLTLSPAAADAANSAAGPLFAHTQPVRRLLGKGAQRTLLPLVEGASGVLRPGVFTILLG